MVRVAQSNLFAACDPETLELALSLGEPSAPAVILGDEQWGVGLTRGCQARPGRRPVGTGSAGVIFGQPCVGARA
jgi:hypothetical protein